MIKLIPIIGALCALIPLVTSCIKFMEKPTKVLLARIAIAYSLFIVNFILFFFV